MNKTIAAFVSGIILGGIILLSISPQTYIDENLEREVRRLRLSGDSLKSIVEKSQTILIITEQRIKELQSERDSLEKLKNKVHEKVIFRTYNSEQLDSILTVLYPSFSNSR